MDLLAIAMVSVVYGSLQRHNLSLARLKSQTLHSGSFPYSWIEIRPMLSPFTKKLSRHFILTEHTGLDELARLATSSPHSTSTSYNNVYHPHSNHQVPDEDYYQRHDGQTNHTISGGSPYPSRSPPQSNLSYVSQPQADPLIININHFELFHHFTSSTAAAITASRATEELWSITIPRLALSHPFLLHSILAISALDIANADPSRSATYYSQASAHHDRALTMAQPDIAKPSVDNVDVLLAFMLTTVFYAFGAAVRSIPQQSSIKDKPHQGVVQCINLLRSIRTITAFTNGWVQPGPLSPLLNMSPHRFRQHDTDEHWAKLLLFASTTFTVGPKEMEDLEICSAAASLLRASLSKVDSRSDGDCNALPMWHWAARLPEEFIDRLEQSDAVPLILVAHWCALLPQTEQYWWTREWVDSTMRNIKAVLPEKYLPWLDWPSEEIRGLRGAQQDAVLVRSLGRDEEARSHGKNGADEDSTMQ